jgi:hypothetical protein
MFRQLPPGADIGFLSSLRQTAELQALDHSLSQFGHDYTSGNQMLNSSASLVRNLGLFTEV